MQGFLSALSVALVGLMSLFGSLPCNPPIRLLERLYSLPIAWPATSAAAM